MKINRSQLTLLIAAAYVIIIGVIGYAVITALQLAHRTGVLAVTASDGLAHITISQNNHAAQVLGTGKATVRLAPGTYYLFATASGMQTDAVVQVSATKTTRVHLNLAKPAAVPSPATVNYVNLNSLINSGLSSDQISLLKQYFFSFKPTVQTITIDPGSIVPLLPSGNSIDFTMNFSLKIDTTPYKATATYPDTTSLHLQLFDAQGKLAYDSAAH